MNRRGGDTKRGGATLIEVVVALLLLTAGALGLASGVAAGERARQNAMERGFALSAAESWLEAWRAGAWPEEGEGSGEMAWSLWTTDLRWRATLRGPCLAEARVETGPTERPQVVLVTRRYLGGRAGCGG